MYFFSARAHMRAAIVWQEEAIRQHSFCRKFSKDDHLHYLLRNYHDMYVNILSFVFGSVMIN